MRARARSRDLQCDEYPRCIDYLFRGSVSASFGHSPVDFRIGTGSWADPEYKALLPPRAGVPAGDRLQAYATHFNHVEVNASTYRTPSPRQTQAWVDQTPDGFSFSVKLHQRFSQSVVRAAGDDVLIRRTRESVQPLVEAGRFTCFLLVLPASFSPAKHSVDELAVLVGRLAPLPVAVELRHHDWVAPEQRERTLAAFKERALVWVAVDMPRIKGATLMPPIDVATRPDFAYLRCHGRNPRWPELKSASEKHDHAYSDSELQDIAARARSLGRSAKVVHVIANNHAHDFAPQAALRLKALLATDE